MGLQILYKVYVFFPPMIFEEMLETVAIDKVCTLKDCAVHLVQLDGEYYEMKMANI
jgi:hypothetical protein